jgi:hypothetical protein
MRLAFFHFRLPVSSFSASDEQSIELSAFGQKGPDAERRKPEGASAFCCYESISLLSSLSAGQGNCCWSAHS